MGLNIDLSKYWLDSNGNVYSSSNPPVKLFRTVNNINYYAIYSPSILYFANIYFKPSVSPSYLILGTFTHVDFKYITMSMHLAPEDLTSEVNELSFFYVISGFTLAVINDMGIFMFKTN